MKKIPCVSAAFLFSIACSFGHTSATSNEFLPCHQMAAKSLQMCLDRPPDGTAADCWAQSRKLNDRCYRDVRKSHATNKPMIDAKRRAEQSLHSGGASKE